MSLAPKWAKASAVLGLRMQIAQFEVLMETHQCHKHKEALDRFYQEIDRIEAMKD